MERARGRYDEETAEIRGNEMTLVENGDRADHVAVAAQHLHARGFFIVQNLGDVHRQCFWFHFFS